MLPHTGDGTQRQGWTGKAACNGTHSSMLCLHFLLMHTSDIKSITTDIMQNDHVLNFI